MTIERLNSQESLERLASYILKAANQSAMIDDESAGATDTTWSSKKIKEEIDAFDKDYVASNVGPSQAGRYMQVDAEGNVISKAMTFESTNIDFSDF